MVRALFHIDLNLDKEYKKWVNEMVQTIVVFGIVHILQILQDPSRGLLNDDFLQALLFTLVGFSFYFLVWKKLVQVVYDDDDDNENDDDTKSFGKTIKLFGSR